MSSIFSFFYSLQYTATEIFLPTEYTKLSVFNLLKMIAFVFCQFIKLDTISVCG